MVSSSFSGIVSALAPLFSSGFPFWASVLKPLEQTKEGSLTGKRAALTFLVVSSACDKKTASDNSEVERKKPSWLVLPSACLFSTLNEHPGEVGRASADISYSLRGNFGERLIEEERLGFESPEYAVIRMEKEERIRSLVNRLLPRERVLMHLRYGIEITTPTISPGLRHKYAHAHFCRFFLGYQSDKTNLSIGYKSLAEALCYGPSYLRTQVGRARRQLRKEMEKEEISPLTLHQQEREGL